MSDHFCDRCGDYLPEGSVKYTVHIQVISDFDGIVLLEEDNAEEEMQRVLREVEGMDEKELEEEVYQELAFTLCFKCKKRFAKDPFNRGARLFRTSSSYERLFH